MKLCFPKIGGRFLSTPHCTPGLMSSARVAKVPAPIHQRTSAGTIGFAPLFAWLGDFFLYVLAPGPANRLAGQGIDPFFPGAGAYLTGKCFLRPCPVSGGGGHCSSPMGPMGEFLGRAPGGNSGKSTPWLVGWGRSIPFGTRKWLVPLALSSVGPTYPRFGALYRWLWFVGPAGPGFWRIPVGWASRPVPLVFAVFSAGKSRRTTAVCEGPYPLLILIPPPCVPSGRAKRKKFKLSCFLF